MVLLDQDFSSYILPGRSPNADWTGFATMRRCQTPHCPLDSDKLAGNALRIVKREQTARSLTIFQCYLSYQKQKLLRKTQRKIRDLQNNPIYFRRFWEIAKSQVSDALPGNQNWRWLPTCRPVHTMTKPNFVVITHPNSETLANCLSKQDKTFLSQVNKYLAGENRVTSVRKALHERFS